MTGANTSDPVVATAVGRVLATAIRVIGEIRGPRPIHTTGLLLAGRLRWLPRTATQCGIAWIDERPSGDVAAIARLSRGVALSAGLPDIIGLAVRSGEAGTDGDLLLASAGIGVPGRFVVHPRWTPTGALLSTFMPYRGDRGPVLIAARSTSPVLPARMEAIRDTLTREPWRLDLMFATPTGLWHRFAELELAPTHGPIDGPTPRFDPVLRPPRGAGTYAWTRVLREPAYAVGRLRGRGPH